MLSLFGKPRFLDADIEDWCLETWAWLMSHFGGMQRLRASPAVVPTREFFPPTETEGHARALYIFDLVKRLVGLESWPCDLEAHDRPASSQHVALVGAVSVGGSASGTFRMAEGRAVVSYASDLVTEPRRLIATFAHELAHYRLSSTQSPIPGGEELRELATDLTVAYTGFGVFGANAAFRFEQHQDSFSQGWRASRSGYLSEPTWAFAVALFADLKGAAPPISHLKQGPADLTRRAAKYLSRNPRVTESLRRIA